MEVESGFEFLLNMKGKYPWDEVSDVDGSAGSSARVQDEFGAFIVEVKDGVEVSVAEENLAFKLKMEFVSVFLHSLQQLGC